MAKDPQKSTPAQSAPPVQHPAPKRFARTREFFEQKIESFRSGANEWVTQYKDSVAKGLEEAGPGVSTYGTFDDPLPYVSKNKHAVVTLPEIPKKETIVNAGMQVSMGATLAGFTSSSLTAFNFLFEKAIGKKIPFGIHRGFYNGGSGVQAISREFGNNPEAFEDPSAQQSAQISSIFNMMAGFAAVGVGTLLFRRPPVNPGIFYRYANSSAGFNITGLLNLAGAGFLLDAAAKESKFQQSRLVEELVKSGISEEESRKIVKETIPHMTPSEEISRNTGLAFSGMGSATGLMSAVVSNPLIAARLSIFSGVFFGLGMAIPLFSFPNSSDESRFSEDRNQRFQEIQQEGFKALVPAIALTAIGAIVLRRNPNCAYLTQFRIHGLDKCDNSFALFAAILSGGAMGVSPIAWREFYATDPRNAEMRRVVESFTQGKDFSTVETSHTVRLQERIAQEKSKSNEAQKS